MDRWIGVHDRVRFFVIGFGSQSLRASEGLAAFAACASTTPPYAQQSSQRTI